MSSSLECDDILFVFVGAKLNLSGMPRLEFTHPMLFLCRRRRESEIPALFDVNSRPRCFFRMFALHRIYVLFIRKSQCKISRWHAEQISATEQSNTSGVTGNLVAVCPLRHTLMIEQGRISCKSFRE